MAVGFLLMLCFQQTGVECRAVLATSIFILLHGAAKLPPDWSADNVTSRGTWCHLHQSGYCIIGWLRYLPFYIVPIRTHWGVLNHKSSSLGERKACVLPNDLIDFDSKRALDSPIYEVSEYFAKFHMEGIDDVAGQNAVTFVTIFSTLTAGPLCSQQTTHAGLRG